MSEIRTSWIMNTADAVVALEQFRKQLEEVSRWLANAGEKSRPSLEAIREGLMADIAAAEAMKEAFAKASASVEADMRKMSLAAQQNGEAWPIWYSKMARATQQAARDAENFASKIAPQTNIRQHAQEVERAAQATQKLAQEQMKAAQMFAPQMNIAAHRKEEAAAVAQVTKNLEQYYSELNKINQALAPQTRISFTRTNGELRAVEAGLGGVGKAAGSANREIGHLVAGFDEIAAGRRGQFMATLGASLRDAGLGAGALVVGVGALATVMAGIGIAREARNLGDWAENARSAASITGMSIGEYTRLQGAMALVGAKVTDANAALISLSRSLGEALADPLSRSAQAFHALGITQDKLVSIGPSTSGALNAIAEAHSRLAANAKRSEAEEAIFRQGAEKIQPLLNRGVEGMRALGDEAAHLGTTLDEQAGAKLVETEQKIDHFSESIRGKAISAFTEWSGAIQGTLDAVGALGNALGWLYNQAVRAGQAVREMQQVSLAIQRGQFMTGPPSGGGDEGFPGAFTAMSGALGLLGSAGDIFAAPAAGLPSAGSMNETKESVKALERLREDASIAGEKAEAKAGGSAQQMRLARIRAELEVLQKGLQDKAIIGRQEVQLQIDVNNKIASLREGSARAGANYAKQEFQAYSKEAGNRLREAAGDLPKQQAILDDWLAHAKEVYGENTMEFRKAQAEIVRVSQETMKKSIDAVIHGLRDQHGAIQNQIREFEAQIQDMVVTKQISPMQGFGFDVQEITRQYDTLRRSIQELYGTPGLTQANINSINQLWDQVNTRGNAAAAEYQAKMDAANEAIIEKWAGPYKNLFSSVSGSLESAIGNAFSGSGSARSSLQSLVRTAFSSGVNAIGTTLSQIIARAFFHAVAGETLSDVFSKMISKAIGSLFDIGTKAIEETPQIVSTTANTLSLDANAVALGLNTTALGALTGAIAFNSAAQFNPEVAGFKLAGGGIIPSAAGGMVLGGGGSFAILHPREMVLPEPISVGLQKMISASGTNQSPGQAPITLNYNANVTGYHPFATRSSFESMLRQNSSSLMRFAQNAMRNRGFTT